ncbi:MAG: MFS transporter [Myxococcota bacterium]
MATEILPPVLGRWSDRAGRRPVLVASQVGTLVAWVLFLVALSLPTIPTLGTLAGATLTLPLLLVFVARAIDGATGGNISVANAYVADMTRDSDAEHRQQAFGRMGMASSLGFVLGPAAAGLLGGTAWGPRLPIAAAALLAFATTIAIVLLLREPKGRCPEGPPSQDAVTSNLHQQDKRCDRAPEPTPDLGVLTQRPVMLILIGTFTLFLGFNVFFSSFPVHAEAVWSWTAGELGTFFAILAGVMITAQGPGLALASRVLSPPALFAVGVCCLLGAMVVLQLPGEQTPYASAVLYALGNGLSWPTFQARVAEVAGDDQGAVQGTASSAGSLASIIGLGVGGALYPLLGSTLFMAAAVMFGIVALLTPLWFGLGPSKEG